jgi:uncharacterized protein DUF998
MTVALVAVAVCDVVTGLALRPMATPGRLALIAGGAAGLLVAASPEPPSGGSLTHAFWATIGFIALAGWPAGGWRRGPSVPFGLRPGVCAAAAGSLLGLLVWFGTELITRGGQVGLAERILTEAQAVWPLAVVLTCRWDSSPVRPPPTGGALTPLNLRSAGDSPPSQHSPRAGPSSQADRQRQVWCRRTGRRQHQPAGPTCRRSCDCPRLRRRRPGSLGVPRQARPPASGTATSATYPFTPSDDARATAEREFTRAKICRRHAPEPTIPGRRRGHRLG